MSRPRKSKYTEFFVTNIFHFRKFHFKLNLLNIGDRKMARMTSMNTKPFTQELQEDLEVIYLIKMIKLIFFFKLIPFNKLNQSTIGFANKFSKKIVS